MASDILGNIIKILSAQVKADTPRNAEHIEA